MLQILAVPVLKENMERAELYIPKPNERHDFFFKWAKVRTRHFINEDIQLVNMHRKKSSLIGRKIKSVIIMQYHL